MTTETLKNPTVLTIPNPVGIDVAIKALQLDLATLPWLEKSFARAFTIPKQVLNQKRLEPMVYQGTKEYFSVLPHDPLKSYSFFRVNGGRTSEEYAANLNTGGAFYFKDPVDLIVWVDLNAIDSSKDYIYTEELIQDVLSVLNRDSGVTVARVWDDKVEDIFRGYTLQDLNRDLLMYPYAAFRIEMYLQYQFECKP